MLLLASYLNVSQTQTYDFSTHSLVDTSQSSLYLTFSLLPYSSSSLPYNTTLFPIHSLTDHSSSFFHFFSLPWLQTPWLVLLLVLIPETSSMLCMLLKRYLFLFLHDFFTTLVIFSLNCLSMWCMFLMNIYMWQNRSPTRQSAPKTCRVCGDEIGLKESGELFVACHECGFPVCRPCYEYERSEGNQCCPGCNSRYKRQKGTAYSCYHSFYAFQKSCIVFYF